MSGYSQSIKNLLEHFESLPGIGPKTAEHLVFYLLNHSGQDLEKFANAIIHLKDNVIRCSKCQDFSEVDPCPICRDNQRNSRVVCVVASPQELSALERTKEYQGTYHVLGGVIDPLEGITPEKLKIKELLARIKKDNITEIILGLSPDMPGETTMIYLTKLLKNYNIKITRLARGLPIGSDLEYADEITLGNALRGRREV